MCTLKQLSHLLCLFGTLVYSTSWAFSCSNAIGKLPTLSDSVDEGRTTWSWLTKCISYVWWKSILEDLEQLFKMLLRLCSSFIVICNDLCFKRVCFSLLKSWQPACHFRNGKFLELIWTCKGMFLHHKVVTLCPDSPASYLWLSLFSTDFLKITNSDLFISLFCI